MNFSKVAQLSIKALEKQRHVFAPEANMFKAGLVSIVTERAHKQYEELTEAIEELKELGKMPE